MTTAAVPMFSEPVPSLRNRRAVGIVGSALFHTLVGALVMFRAPAERQPEPVPASPRSRVVWVSPVEPTPKATVRPRPERRAETPRAPIDYAAASAGAKQPGWREQLPRALALQSEGVDAPSFVIENLDRELVSVLTSRRLALVVAGRPPFDRGARQVRWTAQGSGDLQPLPASWTRQVARRAIVLPRPWIERLQLAPGEEVYMLITTDLDAAILAAQLAAAEERGLPLKALLRTRGRLVESEDGGISFRVDAVDLQS